MHFVKPSWLVHQGDKGKVPIYSVHIHPDGSRLATGGIDGKIRIWSTKAIYDPVLEESDDEPKLLCTLSTHTGVVLCVRFSPNGQYLASGSDDKIVMIWQRDMSGHGLGKIFGSNEVNVENWRSVKRLVGHENDVQDLNWSPDNHLLVSVGLDSAIMVWNAQTFEKIKRIESHQSHVKGITFDPALKYFATESDDRTVKIWRTTDFALEKTISQPFHNSPSTTYFRRPSWSPDGSHIAAANAMNGPVSTVVIIDRGTWNSDISLIGHESPVEVTAFNPRMFRAANSGPANGEGGQQWITIIACAGQDRVLSIWNTLNPRPLVITQDIAEKSISDLCWSPEGMSLFISSYDGSITVCIFEEGDLGKPLPLEENVQFLVRYGHDRHGILLPESPAQLELEKKSKEKEAEAPAKMMAALMGVAPSPVQETATPAAISKPPSPPKTTSTPSSPHNLAPKLTLTDSAPQVLQQKVTITKDGKKRVAPMFLGSSANTPIATSMPESKLLPSQNLASENIRTLDLSSPSVALPRGGMPTMVIGNKRKQTDSAEEEVDGTVSKQTNGVPKEPQSIPSVLRPAIVSPASGVSQVRLGVPRVMSHFDYSPGEKTGILLEARNGAGQANPSRITLSKGKSIVWADYIPRAVLLMAGNEVGYAAACEDGSVITWTKTGRRLLPPIILEAQPCFLESQGHFLMCITSVGMLHIWSRLKVAVLIIRNLMLRNSPHPPISLAPILDSASMALTTEPTSSANITNAGITRAGVPVITLGNGDAFTYSKEMFTWLRLSESWWAVTSQYWDASGLKPPAGSNVQGTLGVVERRTDDEVLKMGRGRYLQRVLKATMLKDGFKGLETAVSIGHLENRLAAAVLLHSGPEYRTTLLMYVQRLAEEGFNDRLEQILLDLLGPAYPLQIRSGAGGESGVRPLLSYGKDGRWESTIAGIDKRTLLREVLNVTGKFRELQAMNVQYHTALKDLEDQDVMAID